MMQPNDPPRDSSATRSWSTVWFAFLSRMFHVTVWLLPTSLRAKHGPAMVALFERDLTRARERGITAATSVGFMAIGDVMRRATYEMVAGPTVPTEDSLRPISVGEVVSRFARPFAIALVTSTMAVVVRYVVVQSMHRDGSTGSPGWTVGELMMLSVPFAMSLTIPFAVFMGMLLVGRRERALVNPPTLGDGSPYTARMTRPIPTSLVRSVAGVSLVLAALHLLVTAEVTPRANARLASALTGHAVPHGDRSMTLPELRAAADAATRTAGQAQRGANTVTGSAAVLPASSSAAAAMARRARFDVEIHKKFVLAVASAILAIVGVLIGWYVTRGVAVLMCSIAVPWAYYVGLVAAESFADRMVVSPAMAMWSLNNVTLAVLLGTLVVSRRQRLLTPTRSTL